MVLVVCAEKCAILSRAVFIISNCGMGEKGNFLVLAMMSVRN